MKAHTAVHVPNSQVSSKISGKQMKCVFNEGTTVSTRRKKLNHNEKKRQTECQTEGLSDYNSKWQKEE